MKSIERLKTAVDFIKKEDKELTNELISLALGYRTKSYVSDILGESKPINDIFLSRIENEYSINPEWIRTGKGQMVKPRDTTIVQEPVEVYGKSQKGFGKIKEVKSEPKSGMPVYEASPMTLSNIESYRDEKQEDPDFWLSIPQYRKCNYACRAKGDSMHPVIRNHALVGGKEILELSVIIFGDIYIVHTKNGIETIKYIHPDPDNTENVLLVPYNGNAKTTPIHKSEILRLYQAEFVINPL